MGRLMTQIDPRRLGFELAVAALLFFAAPFAFADGRPATGAVADPAGATSAVATGVRALIDDGRVQMVEAAPIVRLGAAGGSADAGADADLYAGWDGSDSLTCLTQAIYFEARSESIAGQQAVAQVVINRSRLPGFPHTVCGVVFEGYERLTGCQFSFACDGSPLEPNDYAAWVRARAVAKRALAGFVYKPMANATHYHASWMTPYWSARMSRIGQIGGHIFYR